MKQKLIDIFLEAVQVTHPSVCLRGYLENKMPKPEKEGRLFILACGKASGAVAEVLDDYFETMLSAPSNTEGSAYKMPDKILAITRHGFGKTFKNVEVIEAGHPFPDAQSVQAATVALDIVSQATKDDVVWVILSGGASALWCAPIDGLTLQQKQGLTKQLLKSGATINQINAVRRQLSKIKAGGLLKAAYPARVVTCAISDVVGDDVDIIGSGPTVLPLGAQADPIAVLKRFKIEITPSIAAALKQNAEEAKPSSESAAIGQYDLIATGQIMLDKAETLLEQQGYEVISLGDRLEGEARDVAFEHTSLLKQLIKTKKQKFALLSGGELTVTVKGTGKGGSNQEYALALAIALDGMAHVCALSADSDGIDGGEGKASDPAGAFIDASTLKKAMALNLSAAAFLENNDSGGFFEQLDDLIHVGLTQTNVNDFRVLIYDNEAQ